MQIHLQVYYKVWITGKSLGGEEPNKEWGIIWKSLRLNTETLLSVKTNINAKKFTTINIEQKYHYQWKLKKMLKDLEQLRTIFAKQNIIWESLTG